MPWRREWQPAPVFLPGKSRGQWGRKESDVTDHVRTFPPLGLLLAVGFSEKLRDDTSSKVQGCSLGPALPPHRLHGVWISFLKS